MKHARACVIYTDEMICYNITYPTSRLR